MRVLGVLCPNPLSLEMRQVCEPAQPQGAAKDDDRYG